MITGSKISRFSFSMVGKFNRGGDYTYDLRELLQRRGTAVFMFYNEALMQITYAGQKNMMKLAVTAAGDIRRLLEMTGATQKELNEIKLVEGDLKRMYRFPGKLRKFGLPEKGKQGITKRF